MNLNTNVQSALECEWRPSKPPVVALAILFFFAAFLPVNAVAATAYLKENAPEFIDQIQGDYGTLVNSAALLHDADAKLILAVIVVESEGNAKVVSRKGAQGLMQLMPKTAKAMGAKNPKEPSQNILAGTKYLKELEDNYGFASPGEVLVAYNMGPTGARRWLKTHDPEEYAYVKNVLYVYQLIEEEEQARALTAEGIAGRISNNEDLIAMFRPLIAEPHSLSLLDFPMTISSGRKDGIPLEN